MSRKTPISVRISEEDLALIDRGARARRMDRTAFLIAAGVSAAEDAVLDRMDATVFMLPDEAVDLMQRSAAEPPAPTDALRRAAARHAGRGRRAAGRTPGD